MSILESLDSGITGLFGQWNSYSTGLVTLLVAVVSYRIMSSRDPDVHPLLLARQAVPSRVRNEGQSAVYRSQAAPHGMPLNSGLNVKEPGAAKWSRGRDGDVRDVWRKTVLGSEDGAKGRIQTVLGSENVVEHKLEDVTRQINLIGKYIADQGGIRVAIYLPNSIEFLATLFACSFNKNLTPVILPYGTEDDELISMLKRAAVDTVVTATGAFPFDDVVKAYPALRQLIWVVDEGSAHMDWNEVPEGIGGKVNVATWQEIVREAPASEGLELPAADAENKPGDVVVFWQSKKGEQSSMVRFSQANLVSGIAGQISAIPTKERFNAKDVFLPGDSLSNIHTLVLTLTALYSNASVALNSVSGPSADLAVATQGVSPTIIAASPESLLRSHDESSRRLGAFGKLSHSLSTQSLTQQGVLSTSNALSSFASNARLPIGKSSDKLRLVYAAERVGAGTPALSAQVLSDLRVLANARVVYALSASPVAGAVTQTAYYDYRVGGEGRSHLGAPLTSVEIFLKDSGSHKTTDDVVEGEIYARGPSVSGGEAGLDVIGRIGSDNTLSYA